jgi:hypothetical protein
MVDPNTCIARLRIEEMVGESNTELECGGNRTIRT